MEPLKYISDVSGTSENGLRILFSLFFAYPIAWIYRFCVHDKDPKVKHLFFVFCGISLGLYNFGYDVCHCIFSVLFSYVSMWLLGPTKINVFVNLFFHVAYLLMGYWVTSSNSYDMTWTMPQCVLCLRLIGFSQDLWDGSKDFDSLSESYKKTALRSKPTLLELFSYVFFPASFLVGPQFSMMRLKNFVSGKLENNSEPTNMFAGAQRALTGLVYLAAYEVGIVYLTEEYFLTEAFLESSFVWKHVILGIWTKIFFMKYVFCWLLTEGACITFGIAYNGTSEDNKTLWNGCRNINLLKFEGCTKFGHYVESFNVNTNTWAAQYVYKRMAFLGNRVLSQAITLAFLCVWHGFHSGYYMAFFMEFVTIFMEKDLENIMKYSERYLKISQNKVFKVITFIALKMYVNIFMGYAFVPFALFTVDKWWPVYRSLYFSGYIFFFPWGLLYRRLAVFLLKPNFKSKEKVK